MARVRLEFHSLDTRSRLTAATSSREWHDYAPAVVLWMVAEMPLPGMDERGVAMVGTRATSYWGEVGIVGAVTPAVR